VQHKIVLQVQKKEWRPLNYMKLDPYALWRSLFILSFEFEYRTIRTIKRDTNNGLGWIQVLIVYLSKILTHTQRKEICCCFAPVVSLFGGSDRTCYSQQRFMRLEVPRFFSKVPNFEI
jgi:hypothetical protein